ncbi:integral membrane protein-like protein [Karstenula rhodostoma CBS 690.94]|uniref:Integral membrane protein-like protein n=1 Tax=Karstenula rhodostoma CBS 690.94 TaxID=1392251 RepID=A0A9P4U580_9PLEO|nr:integral membrane protein-like protein [Karstenula rhodostoma CBS 690.94]
MRPTALIPALLSAAALVLAFLCLFAGHKKDFMEDYHILTLNTSRLGEGVINGTLGQSDSTLGSLWNLVPDSIQNDVSEAAGVVTEKLGIEDFYSAHLLDYCYGQYTPAESPNATLPASAIHKNVSACSNQTAMFYFNPTQIIEDALAKSGLDITLDDLEWPSDIQRGLDALRIVSVTAFVLYCISIGLIFLSFVGAVVAVFAAGRLSACVNLLVGILAFVAIGLASALVTAVIEKGGDVINEKGADVGVVAGKGRRFMALTWAATGLVGVVLVVWVVEMCAGRRRRGAYGGAKHG